jgi:septal ring factor EnvC (AmiA/AmiB activator)
MTGETVLLILGALFTAVSGMIVAYVNRQSGAIKEQFDALKEMVNISHNEIERLQLTLTKVQVENAKLNKMTLDQEGEIAELRREIIERDGTLKQVKAWAEALVAQLKENGLHPVPMPDREATKPFPKRGKS